MTKAKEFLTDFAAACEKALELPYDTWVKDYLVKPEQSRLRMNMSETFTVTATEPLRNDPVDIVRMIEATLKVEPMLASRIVESRYATKLVEDWSGVRSPARARRRLKRGFRQNITYRGEPASYQVGDTLIVHPDYGRELRKAAAATVEKQMDIYLLGALMGMKLCR